MGNFTPPELPVQVIIKSIAINFVFVFLLYKLLHVFQLPVVFNCKYVILTMLLTPLARDASALGSIKVEVPVKRGREVQI